MEKGPACSRLAETERPAILKESIQSLPPALTPSLVAGASNKLSGLSGRLRLDIPSTSARLPAHDLSQRSSTISSAQSITPLSESPETPSSTSSPITGVVDLTKYIRLVSNTVVAHGGLSDIYKGEKCGGPSVTGGDAVGDTDRPILVAVKVLRIFRVKDQDGVRARKRLNREVYVWHRLEHPNVVKLFGTSYHMGGRPSMIMQWYENGSAAEYLSKKNPSANRMHLVHDVAKGLEYLHTLRPPIIHGDLKGNNVLITDEGRAVLCDFGLSKVIEELGHTSGLTSSPGAAGPIRWQAPELMQDDDAEMTLSSDIWSFGCTAFEILAGVLPYSHRTKDALVLRDMNNGCKPSSDNEYLLARFPPYMHHVLDRCWSFSPFSRPTMSVVIADLES